MKYPQKMGETIGVTATSGGLDAARDLVRLENAIKNFEEMGFQVEESPNVRKRSKLVSSSAQARAEEFMLLWNDERIHNIILARGGEFLMEMLPYLNLEALSEGSPKWVQGFSDSSLLLFYLTTHLDIATIHASNFTGYCMEPVHESLLTTIEFLKNPEKPFKQESFELYEKEPVCWQEGMELEPYALTEKVVYHNLYGEQDVQIEGRLLGGCMDVLKCIIGTSYDTTKEFCQRYPEGILWYLENCEMPVTELYRTLWQMKEAGWFANAKGFLIGRTMSSAAKDDFTYEDAMHQVFDDMHVPVVYDVDFGHVAPQWTMVNGAFATFEYHDGKGIMESTLK